MGRFGYLNEDLRGAEDIEAEEAEAASFTDPVMRTREIKAGRPFDIPGSLVSDAPDLERQQRLLVQQRLQQESKRYPELNRHFRDPERAAGGWDDVGSISGVIDSVLDATGISRVGQAYTSGKANVDMVSIVASVMAADKAGVAVDPGVFAKLERLRQEQAAFDPGDLGLEDVIPLVAQQIPNLSLMAKYGIAGAALAGTASSVTGFSTLPVAIPLGGTIGAALAMSPVEMTSAYMEYRELQDEAGNKLDPDIAIGMAASYGVMAGAVEAGGSRVALKFASILGISIAGSAAGQKALDSLAAKKLMRRALANTIKGSLQGKTKRELFKTIGKAVSLAVVSQGLEEGTQEWLNVAGGVAAQAIERQSTGAFAELDVFEGLIGAETRERVGEAAAIGSLTGLGIAGAGATVGGTAGLAARSLSGKAEAAETFGEKLGRMEEVRKNSRLAQEDPVAFAEAVETETRNLEPVSIDAAGLVKFYQGDLAAVEAAVPSLTQEAISTAADAGMDVQIPFSEYVAYVSGSKLSEGFKVNARVDGRALTLSQVEGLSADLDQQLELAKQAEEEDFDDAAYNEFVTDIFDQLTGAGVNERVARMTSKVWGAAQFNLAERAGFDPLEEYAGARITGPAGAGRARALFQPVSDSQVVGEQLELFPSEAGLAEEVQTDALSLASQIIDSADSNNEIVLFNSATAERDPDIREFGVIAQHGEWVTEILQGATDSEETIQELLDRPGPAFFDDTPSWVTMQVARKLNKHVGQVTIGDVREHGQLSIVKVDRDDTDFVRIPEEGDGVTVESLRGEGYKFWETDAAAAAESEEIPFSAERRDILTFQDVEPDITLTGDDLIRFLQSRFPEANLTERGRALFQDSVQSISSQLAASHPTIDFTLLERRNGNLELASIVVPKEERKQGTGTAFMEDLVAAADASGKIVELTPATRDDVHGTTSRGRLVKFYKRFGFVENKGRNKDFTLRADVMFREPEPRAFGPNVLFQPAAPLFFSRLQQEVEARLPSKGTGKSYLQALNAMAKSGKIKREELDYSGLVEWLQEQGKVTKEQLLEFAREGGVKLQTVVSGSDVPATGLLAVGEEAVRSTGEELRQVREAAVQVLQDAGFDAGKAIRTETIIERRLGSPEGVEALAVGQGIAPDFDWDSLRVAKAAFDSAVSELPERASVRFEDYVLPGPQTDYRETLLTLPKDFEEEGITDTTGWTATRVPPVPHDDAPVWDVRDEAGERLGNVEASTAEFAIAKAGNRKKIEQERTRRGQEEFVGEHFDTPNVVAWTRTNTRTDTSGDEVLFIEEIQSDWHQRGRKVGFAGGPEAVPAHVAPVLEEVRALGITEPINRISAADILNAGGEQSLADTWVVFLKDGDLAVSPGVPDVPFKKTWPLLAFKHALRQAVEQGADKVAWTTGDQQANRYDLSKQISSIAYSGTNFKAFGLNGEEVISRTGVKPEELEGLIGKEAASRLMAQEPKGTLRTLEGEGLKVGGTGMRKFYDELLVNAVKKYTKKWGGKVTTTELEGAGGTLEGLPDFEFISAVEADVGIGDLDAEVVRELGDVEDLSGLFVAVDANGEFARDSGGSVMVAEDQTDLELAIEDEATEFRHVREGPAEVHSIEITDAMRESIPKGQELFQPQGRAEVSFSERGELLINLKAAADESTALHEFSHGFLDKMVRLGANLEADHQINRDLGIIREWWKGESKSVLKWLKDNQNKLPLGAFEEIMDRGGASYIAEQALVANLDLNADMDLAAQGATIGFHEHFARGAELYMYEGKAPSSQLRDAFAAFVDWMTEVYKDVRAALGVELNDEVRGVLDRLVASDAQIEAAQRERSDELQNIESALELSPKAAEELQEAREQKAREAKQTVRQRALKAERRKRKQLESSLRPEIQRQVEQEISERRDYKAHDYVKARKLNRPAVVSLVTKELASAVARFTSPKGPTLPEELQGRYGYDSVPEMLEAIAGLPPIKQAVKEETDRRLLERLGPPEVEQPVESVVESTAGQEKVLKAELAAITGQAAVGRAARLRVAETGAVAPAEQKAAREAAQEALAAATTPEETEAATLEIARLEAERAPSEQERRSASSRRSQEASVRRQARAEASELKAVAEARVANLRSAEVKPEAFLRAQDHARREVDRALRDRNYVVALEHQRRRVMLHFAHGAAVKAQKKIKNAVKRAKQLQKASTQKSIGAALPSALEQINSLLDRAGLLSARISNFADISHPPMIKWMETREAAGEDVGGISPFMLGHVPAFEDMKLHEVEAFDETLKAIREIARLSDVVVIDGESHKLADIVDRLVASIEENDTSRKKIPSKDRNVIGFVPLAKRALRRFDATLIKMEQIIDWLDGGDIEGPMREFVFTQISAAQAAEADMQRDIPHKIIAAFEALSKRRLNTKIFIPEVDETFRVSDIMSVALNLGTESSYQKVKEGESWDDTQIDAILAHLNDAELDTVEEIWTTLEELGELLFDTHEELTGIRPSKLEVRSFTTPGGREMSGGYYPAVYDPTKGEQGAKNYESGNAPIFENNYTTRGVDTTTGATIGRTRFAAPFWFDMSVLPSHVSEVIHDVTHRQALNNVWRVVSNGRVRGAIDESLGVEYREMFKPWLQSIGNDKVGVNKDLRVWARMFSGLRTNTAIMAMGLKATTQLSQIAGFSNSMGRAFEAGYRGELLNQMRLAILHPIEMRDYAFAKSGEMRNRAKNLDRDLRDVGRKLAGKSGVLQKSQQFSMHGIAVMDLVVSVPTWHAGYNAALKQGLSEKAAIEFGDREVRLSQGGGGAKDLAEVQRGAEFWKLFTNFYSFLSALYSQIRDTGHQVHSLRDVPQAMAKYFFYVTVGSMLAEALSNRWPDEDDDMTALEMALWKSATAPLTTVPILREFVGVVESGRTYQLSPTQAAGESVARVLTQTIDLFDEDSDVDFGQFSKNTLQLTGYMLGLPINQLQITFTNVRRVIEEGADYNLWDILFYQKEE